MTTEQTIADSLSSTLTAATAKQSRAWALKLWDGGEPDRREFGDNLAAAMLVSFLDGLGAKPAKSRYAADNRLGASGPLFIEAMDALRRKNVVLGVNSPREVDEKLMQTAFFVSGVTSENIVEQIRQELTRVREAGLGRDSFIAAVDKLADLSGDHLDIVWRTNLAAAASAGRWAQYHAPAVEGMYVAYEWRSARVAGTRPLHRAMHRFVASKDDPIWRIIWPPGGYRCLCSVLALTEERAATAGFKGQRVFQDALQEDVVDAAEAGYAIVVDDKAAYFPDKGFRGNALIN